MTGLITQAFFETIIMVVVSFLIGLVFGIPLAITLYNSSSNGLRKNKFIYSGVGFLVNATRSIPYIILIILLLPVSRFIAGSTIGLYAAIIPLGLSAILLVAKTVEEALKTVPLGVIESGVAMGASINQIIWKIVIPESMPTIVSGLTIILINLVGFSAMAGAVGGGGLGDLAIRYGYQRYNIEIMFIIILILIALIQIIQIIGNKISILTRK